MINFIKPEAIAIKSKVGSKKQLFVELSKMLADQLHLDPTQIYDALMASERTTPTTIGQGVDLPCARIKGLTHPVGAFIMLEHPLDFDAFDGQPVDLIFALLTPDENESEHLTALSLVARLFRNSAICHTFRGCSHPEALYAILVEQVQSVAA